MPHRSLPLFCCTSLFPSCCLRTDYDEAIETNRTSKKLGGLQRSFASEGIRADAVNVTSEQLELPYGVPFTLTERR